MAQFQIEAVEARFGDCLIVRWGDGNGRLMLIDGGPGGVYEDRLRPVLVRLRGELGIDEEDELPLQLAAVSHIDGDHILGIEGLLNEVQRSRNDLEAEIVSIGRFWLNAFDELVSGGGASPTAVLASLDAPMQAMHREEARAVAASVPQGRRTRDVSRGLGLPGNLHDGTLVRSGDALPLDDDLNITVVAPDGQLLDELKEEWQATPASDTARIAALVDDRIPNLSSIVMHVERNGSSALFTGDARSDTIEAGLRANDLMESDACHVDVLKVQHHGSQHSMEPGFFERVTADHYVISANGHHHHPSEATLQAIVDARGNDEYTVHLTNPVPHAVTLLETEAQKPGRRFEIDVRAAGSDSLAFDVG